MQNFTNTMMASENFTKLIFNSLMLKLNSSYNYGNIYKDEECI